MYEKNLTISNGTNHKQQKHAKRKSTSKANAVIIALTECNNPRICEKKKKIHMSHPSVPKAILLQPMKSITEAGHCKQKLNIQRQY
jgi:hypothetical protein